MTGARSALRTKKSVYLLAAKCLLSFVGLPLLLNQIPFRQDSMNDILPLQRDYCPSFLKPFASLAVKKQNYPVPCKK